MSGSARAWGCDSPGLLSHVQQSEGVGAGFEPARPEVIQQYILFEIIFPTHGVKCVTC